MPKNVRLTQFSSGAGWACKLNPEGLQEVLNNLKHSSSQFDQISFETSDDAALYTLENGYKIIQSVDFFTPIVDDPFTFGQIAAANSLSDIYAMGGKPLFALNIAAFPSDDLPLSILSDILNGGISKAKEAGIPILGGHTIKDKEPKYGLVVTGKVEESTLTRNNTAKEGDVLVLTKPLGTGIISTAIKKDLATKRNIEDSVAIMKTLNDYSSKIMSQIGVNACTDITGYGLLGHLLEMCKGSKVSAKINYNNVQLIDGVKKLAKDGLIPGGTKNNYNFVKNNLELIQKNNAPIKEYETMILADAQTSGGLLLSVDENKAVELIRRLNDGNSLRSYIIGDIKKNDDDKSKIFIVKE